MSATAESVSAEAEAVVLPTHLLQLTSGRMFIMPPDANHALRKRTDLVPCDAKGNRLDGGHAASDALLQSRIDDLEALLATSADAQAYQALEGQARTVSTQNVELREQVANITAALESANTNNVRLEADNESLRAALDSVNEPSLITDPIPNGPDGQTTERGPDGPDGKTNDQVGPTETAGSSPDDPVLLPFDPVAFLKGVEEGIVAAIAQADDQGRKLELEKFALATFPGLDVDRRQKVEKLASVIRDAAKALVEEKARAAAAAAAG